MRISQEKKLKKIRHVSSSWFYKPVSTTCLLQNKWWANSGPDGARLSTFNKARKNAGIGTEGFLVGSRSSRASLDGRHSATTACSHSGSSTGIGSMKQTRRAGNSTKRPAIVVHNSHTNANQHRLTAGQSKLRKDADRSRASAATSVTSMSLHRAE